VDADEAVIETENGNLNEEDNQQDQEQPQAE